MKKSWQTSTAIMHPNRETADAIAKLYSDTGYVIDTHTAVAAAVYGKYREENL